MSTIGQVVDDAVGQTEGGHQNGICLYAAGYVQEDFGCGHNDVGTVGLQSVALHPLFYGELAQLVVELL